MAASRRGRSETKRSINSLTMAALSGIELRRRSIRARLIVASPATRAADSSPAGASESLLFAGLTFSPFPDRFVAQPPHEAIQRRAPDPEIARGFGPIALGLG